MESHVDALRHAWDAAYRDRMHEAKWDQPEYVLDQCTMSWTWCCFFVGFSFLCITTGHRGPKKNRIVVHISLARSREAISHGPSKKQGFHVVHKPNNAIQAGTRISYRLGLESRWAKQNIEQDLLTVGSKQSGERPEWGWTWSGSKQSGERPEQSLGQKFVRDWDAGWS